MFVAEGCEANMLWHVPAYAESVSKIIFIVSLSCYESVGKHGECSTEEKMMASVPLQSPVIQPSSSAEYRV